MSGPGGGGDAASSSASKRRRRPEPTPVQRALGLLTRREHSRKELTRKLASRGVEADAAAAAIDRLAEAGWQDEARFAESVLRCRSQAGYGPRYIRAELRTHGLPEAMVAGVLDGFQGDWRQIARELVRRRHPSALRGDLQAARKAADLLLRRGFSGDQLAGAMAGQDETEGAWGPAGL